MQLNFSFGSRAWGGACSVKCAGWDCQTTAAAWIWTRQHPRVWGPSVRCLQTDMSAGLSHQGERRLWHLLVLLPQPLWLFLSQFCQALRFIMACTCLTLLVNCCHHSHWCRQQLTVSPRAVHSLFIPAWKGSTEIPLFFSLKFIGLSRLPLHSSLHCSSHFLPLAFWNQSRALKEPLLLTSRLTAANSRGAVTELSCLTKITPCQFNPALCLWEGPDKFFLTQLSFAHSKYQWAAVPRVPGSPFI